MVTLDDILKDPNRAQTLNDHDRADLAFKCSAVQSVLAAVAMKELGATSVSPNTGDRLLRAKEVAARLGYSVWKLYRRAADGKIPFALRDGGQWLFSEKGLNDWVTTRGVRESKESR